MKKSLVAIIAVVAVALCAIAADQLAVDMADHGTTASITNTITLGSVTYDKAFVTYDSAGITNDIVIYATVGGVDYKLGTSSVTNGQYDYVSLNNLALSTGGAICAQR
jgi:hypothetical protein